MIARRGSPGFTLIEVLVSAALVSVVLGLALKGFTEAKKIADITKAKVIAEEEASQGVQKLAKILRRTHVIYFDARPLAEARNDVPALNNLAGIREAAPPTWLTGDLGITQVDGTALGVPTVNMGVTTSEAYRSPIRDGFGAGVARSKFFTRHLIDGTDGTEDGAAVAADSGYRLKTGERTAANNEFARNFDRFFTSPLLYCAEATFNSAPPAAGAARIDANLPMTWTFHLVYLAPMRFERPTDDGHALFPVQETGNPKSLNHIRDQGPEGWVRATVPYELRLLTIPDVRAVNIGAAANANYNPTAMPLPNRIGYNLGRRIDDVSVLPFPYDIRQNRANYDPVPMPIGAATYNSMVATSTNYGPASGERVRSAANDHVHGNWDNIGNDPPTQLALELRARWNGTAFVTGAANVTPITDTLLARYVDPDAIHGTFVRLANDQNLINENETNPRPYVNAYGGPQRYNPSWWKASNPTTVAPPRRALVSVSTRFRFSRQHPFAFSTESVEVDLDPLNKFQAMDFRKRR